MGKIMATLYKKWSLSDQPSPNGLSLMPGRKMVNMDAQNNNKPIIFDPSVILDGPIVDGFRVFIDADTVCVNLAIQEGRAPGILIQDEAITAYTDGSCLNNGSELAQVGCGVYFYPPTLPSIVKRVPG